MARLLTVLFSLFTIILATTPLYSEYWLTETASFPATDIALGERTCIVIKQPNVMIVASEVNGVINFWSLTSEDPHTDYHPLKGTLIACAAGTTEGYTVYGTTDGAVVTARVTANNCIPITIPKSSLADKSPYPFLGNGTADSVGRYYYFGSYLSTTELNGLYVLDVSQASEVSGVSDTLIPYNQKGSWFATDGGVLSDRHTELAGKVFLAFGSVEGKPAQDVYACGLDDLHKADTIDVSSLCVGISTLYPHFSIAKLLPDGHSPSPSDISKPGTAVLAFRSISVSHQMLDVALLTNAFYVYSFGQSREAPAAVLDLTSGLVLANAMLAPGAPAVTATIAEVCANVVTGECTYYQLATVDGAPTLATTEVALGHLCGPGEEPMHGVCTPCDVDKYSPHGVACVACPEGSGTGVEGASECLCLGGWFKPVTGDTCEKCPHTTSTLPYNKSIDCYCDAGYEKSMLGMCAPCGDGLVKPVVSSPAETERCLPCAAPSVYHSPTACYCDAGHYFTGEVTADSHPVCATCPEGTYTSAPTLDHTCGVCSPTMLPNDTRTGCVCRENYIPSDDGSDCVAPVCPAHRYFNYEKHACVGCPVFHKVDGAQHGCTVDGVAVTVAVASGVGVITVGVGVIFVIIYCGKRKANSSYTTPMRPVNTRLAPAPARPAPRPAPARGFYAPQRFDRALLADD